MRAPRLAAILLCLLSLGLSAGAIDAAAFRQAERHQVGGPEDWLEPPAFGDGTIEGACGLAISPSGTLYVSDYYHRAIHSYSLGGTYGGTQVLAGGDPSPPIVKLDAVCGMAIDGSGTRYGNEYHQRVIRLPGEEEIDTGNARGIAVDDEGDLYVNDRTHVAVYDAPVVPGEAASLQIGLGSLEDAYGVAVSSASGLVYVPDAAGQTVKVFDPAGNPAVPVDTIAGPPGIGFRSLVDASLAIDESATEGNGTCWSSTTSNRTSRSRKRRSTSSRGTGPTWTGCR